MPTHVDVEGHERVVPNAYELYSGAKVDHDDPSKVVYRPVKSVATQKDEEAQARLSVRFASERMLRAVDQDEPSKVVHMLVHQSIARQKVGDVHDTSRLSLGSIAVGDDHVLPSNRTARPWLSTTMQNEVETHETDIADESTDTALDHAEPSYVRASPFSSTHTQKDGDAHETTAPRPVVKGVMIRHVVPFQVSVVPIAVAAIQKVRDVQDTEVSSSFDPSTIGCGVDQEPPS
jgi:hypothetical protein